jgi:hypothetical protein
MAAVDVAMGQNMAGVLRSFDNDSFCASVLGGNYLQDSTDLTPGLPVGLSCPSADCVEIDLSGAGFNMVQLSGVNGSPLLRSTLEKPGSVTILPAVLCYDITSTRQSRSPSASIHDGYAGVNGRVVEPLFIGPIHHWLLNFGSFVLRMPISFLVGLYISVHTTDCRRWIRSGWRRLRRWCWQPSYR